MTYNVFGGTLNLTQSINHSCSHKQQTNNGAVLVIIMHQGTKRRTKRLVTKRLGYETSGTRVYNAVSKYIRVRTSVLPYTSSLNCHGGAMVVFYKLCRTAWSSRVDKTESVLVMGHARLTAESSIGLDHWTRDSANRYRVYYYDAAKC